MLAKCTTVFLLAVTCLSVKVELASVGCFHSLLRPLPAALLQKQSKKCTAYVCVIICWTLETAKTCYFWVRVWKREHNTHPAVALKLPALLRSSPLRSHICWNTAGEHPCPGWLLAQLKRRGVCIRRGTSEAWRQHCGALCSGHPRMKGVVHMTGDNQAPHGAVLRPASHVAPGNIL